MTNEISFSKPVFTDGLMQLCNLRLSFANVRQHSPKPSALEVEGIRELASMIDAVGGLLLPLIVNLAADGFGEVVAGGRRLAALRLLQGEGRLQTDMVPVRVTDCTDLALLSTIENVGRVAMHPVDECTAYQTLREQGRTVEQIAQAFGEEVRHVSQRLALAAVHPQILAAYRKGDVNLDAVKTYTIEADKARQLSAWKSLGQYRRNNPYHIRSLLSDQEIDLDSPLVKLVGVQSYLDAGGAVRRDLFESKRDTLTDVLLLEGLAAAILQATADELEAQGWGWVRVLTEFPHDETRGLQRVGNVKKSDYSLHGFFVYCDHKGEVCKVGPYAKSAQLAKMRKAETAGNAGEGDAVEDDAPVLSMVLRQSLAAHKTAAFGAALRGNQRVTLAVLAAQMLGDMLGGWSPSRTLTVRLTDAAHDVGKLARGFGGSPLAAQYTEVLDAWRGRVAPHDAGKLVPWFLDQPEAVAVEAIAFAASCSAVMLSYGDAGPKLPEAIEQALSFRLTDHYRPTAETYFSAVTMKQLGADLAEACGPAAAQRLAGLKKGEAVALVASEIAATDWVPGYLQA